MWRTITHLILVFLEIVKGQYTPSGCVYTADGGHKFDRLENPMMKINWDSVGKTIELDMDSITTDSQYPSMLVCQYFKDCFVQIASNNYVKYSVYKIKDGGNSIAEVNTNNFCSNTVTNTELISSCDYQSEMNKLMFQVKIPEA